MNLDDQICYCYHVPLRKLLNFARRTRPSRASQISECLGAGTGCGWCIPILLRLHAAVAAETAARAAAGTPGATEAAANEQAANAPAVNAPGAMEAGDSSDSADQRVIGNLPDTAAEYAAARQRYISTQQPKNRFDEKRDERGPGGAGECSHG